MNRPVPEADPVAYAHDKYELENRGKRSLIGKAWGPFSSHPNTINAAKSGTPQMTSFHPTIPASVPASAANGDTGTGEVTAGGGSDVSVGVSTNSSTIDKSPDARMSQGGGNQAAPATPASPAGDAATGVAAPAKPGAAADAAATPLPKPDASLPQNHTGITKKLTPAEQLKQQRKMVEAQKKMAAASAKQRKKQEAELAKTNKKKDSGQPAAPAAPPPATQQ